MKAFLKSSGASVDLVASSRIGRGGEGEIFALPGRSDAAKIYFKPDPVAARKLQVMIANPPRNPTARMGHPTFAWPTDILLDGSGKMVGFVMPRVTDLKSIVDVYNPRERIRKSPGFNYRYLHSTAKNLASAFESIHASGHVIGDVNESNVLVAASSMVTFVDTDSFQISDPGARVAYRCTVGKDQYTPPELVGKTLSQIDRAPSADRFGLAVLVHQLLFEGTHPFDGVFSGQGSDPSTSERIAKGYYPRCVGRTVPVRPRPLSVPLSVVHPGIAALLAQCFDASHANPSARPDARAWRKAIEAAEASLRTCAVNANHVFGSHLPACPWCEWGSRLGRDSFPPVGVPLAQPSASQGTIAPPAGPTKTGVYVAPTPPAAPVPRPTPVPMPAVSTWTPPRQISVPPTAHVPSLGSSALAAPRQSPAAGAAVVVGVLLVLGVIVSRFSCSSSHGGHGDACSNSADCSGSLVCVNAHCCTTRLSAGERCSDTRDCEAGLSCADGRCQLPAPPARSSAGSGSGSGSADARALRPDMATESVRQALVGRSVTIKNGDFTSWRFDAKEAVEMSILSQTKRNDSYDVLALVDTRDNDGRDECTGSLKLGFRWESSWTLENVTLGALNPFSCHRTAQWLKRQSPSGTAVVAPETVSIRGKTYRIPDMIKEKYPDVPDLIRSTKSMDDEDRESWYGLLPQMTAEQISKFRDIMIDEREQLKKLENSPSRK